MSIYLIGYTYGKKGNIDVADGYKKLKGENKFDYKF
jgi:hypothetical protein